MKEAEKREQTKISHTQRVAILIDANNIERSIEGKYGKGKMLNYDFFIHKVLRERGLNNFVYFIEGGGEHISGKFMERLAKKYFGDVMACFKSADVPLAMHAAILMSSVDTYIIFSGDADYIDCVTILKAHGKRVEIVGVEGAVSQRLAGMVHDCTYIAQEDIWQDAWKKPRKKNISTTIQSNETKAITTATPEATQEKAE